MMQTKAVPVCRPTRSRKHIVPMGIQPQIMAQNGKLSKHSPRAQGQEKDSQ